MVDREQGLERTKFNAPDKSTGQESTCLREFTRYWWSKCEHAMCILAADSEDRLTYGTTVLAPVWSPLDHQISLGMVPRMSNPNSHNV